MHKLATSGAADPSLNVAMEDTSDVAFHTFGTYVAVIVTEVGFDELLKRSASPRLQQSTAR